MANTISSYFENAQLSLAAYATLNTQMNADKPAYRQALFDAGMSLSEAIRFADTYSIIHQYSDPSSGFSATVFRKGTETFFAIRGTEIGSGFPWITETDLGDLLSDAALALNGIAADQTIAMYNYYQRLIHQPSDAVPQLTKVVGDSGTHLNLTLVSGVGLGKQAEMTWPLTIAGHSLGGHLGMAFGRLFDSNVSQLYTYNAPGFSDAAANAFFDEINSALGISQPSSYLDDSRSTNLYGIGNNIIAGYGTTYGADLPVFLETNTHSVIALTDSLAIYDLFAKIDSTLNTTDPAVGVGKITDILKASSAQAANSLERAVDALVNFLGLEFTPLAGNQIDDREAFYQRVVPLQTVITNLTANSTLVVDVLVNTAAADLANIAQGSTAFGYRYALRELNPFAILGNNDLYAPHNANGALDLYNAGTRTGTLTADWITDRAKLLNAELVRNTQDNPDLARLPGTGDTATEYHHYRGGKEEVFFAQPENSSPGQYPTEVVMFADDAGRLLTGTNNLRGDHLYGGAGTDYLIGKANDDSLEGGKGLDIYQYNASSGGANDGADSIRDTDGKGVLRYTFTQSGFFSSTVQSTVIADASVQVSGLQWNSADGKFSYTRSQNDLVVTINGDAGGSITLKDFRDGDFGIRLWEVRATPQTSNTINAVDYEDNETIFDTAANDLILGDGRGNFVNASTGGSNWIQVGDGRDIVYALTASTADAHLIEGGAGDDLLTGGPGNDELYANVRVGLAEAINAGSGAGNGLHGDWLSGDWGDDLLVGDASNDGFAAGPGRDIVVAGAGDDNIFGDADWVGTTLDWFYEDDPATDTRNFFWFNGTDNYDVGDADVIYAGSGEDYVWAGGGDDLVWGELGNDRLLGNSGSDVLIGGTGNDQLFGGAGKDIYVFNKGDGTETVFDDDTSPNNPEASVLVLGEGVNRSDIKFRPGSLAVDIGPSDPTDPNSPHDVIHFNGFNQLDSTATTPLGEIRFADGSSMSYADILAQGFDIDGTEGDDNSEPGAAPQLIGTSVTDRIQAFGGNDVAAGGGGDDTLFGGSGNDLLHGDADNVPAANQGADFLSGGTGMMERINGTHPFFYSFFTRQR